MDTTDLTRVRERFLALQDDLCNRLEALDGKAKFVEDAWTREEGGGGRSRVLREGRVFEQAGINFSHVFGAELPRAASVRRPELAGCAFQALRPYPPVRV